jgi:hypothetical protein
MKKQQFIQLKGRSIWNSTIEGIMQFPWITKNYHHLIYSKGFVFNFNLHQDWILA